MGPCEPPRPALEPERADSPPWIVEPDPVVLRAGLAAALVGPGVAPLGPRLGFLGPREASQPPPPGGPFLHRWRVLGSAPADPKRVRRLLAEADVGPVRVRVRGHPESAATLERRFRGRGSRPGTVLVARLARGHRAYLVDELA